MVKIQNLKQTCESKNKKTQTEVSEDVPTCVNIQKKIVKRCGRGSPERGITRKQSRQKAFDRKKHMLGYKVQSDSMIGLGLSKMDMETVVDFCENACIFMHGISRVQSKTDLMFVLGNFVKLTMKSPLFSTKTLSHLHSYGEKVFDLISTVQSDNPFEGMRNFLDQYQEIRRAPIFRHAYKLFVCALSTSFFADCRIPFVKERYCKIEKEMMKCVYEDGKDFIETALSSLLFVCERGYQCMVTGSLDPIFHAEGTYEKWVSKAHTLRRQSAFLANPAPHGIDKYQYLWDLREAIDVGKKMKEHARRVGDTELRIVRALLGDLETILATEITKRAASRTRQAPFAVLICGDSSVGKSTFTRVLFYHYGKVFGLPIDDEYQYFRNPKDEFWSGYNSCPWSIVLDDIADIKVTHAPSGDPSLSEIIQVVNFTAFCPNQAALEDKGKTPMMARQVIATTNTKDLNAYSYFSCPLAVQRRLPFIFHISVKEEYVKNSTMIDSTKLPQLEPGEYPNYWNIRVEEVQPEPNNQGISKRARYVHLGDFTDINEFLDWYASAAKAHEVAQDAVAHCNTVMKDIVLCSVCKRTERVCTCDKLQSDREISLRDPDVLLAEINAPTIVVSTDFHEECQDPLLQEDNTSFSGYILCMLLFLIVRFPLLRRLLFCILDIPSVNSYMSRLFRRCGQRNEALLFRILGHRIHNFIGYHPKLVIGAKVATAVLSCAITCKLIQMMVSFFSSSEQVQSEGRRPVPQGNERPNVWYKDDYQTTNFDISPQTSSWKALGFDEVKCRLKKNCSLIMTACEPLEESRGQNGVAICIGGHVYMTNNHSIPYGGPLRVRFASNDHGGVGNAITISYPQEQVLRFPEKDLAFLIVKSLPPRKTIIDLFVKESLRGVLKGEYVTHPYKGNPEIEVNNIKLFLNQTSDAIDGHFDYWRGTSNHKTYSGLCGAPLLANHPQGPVIVGVHQIGNKFASAALRVTREELHDMIGHLMPNVTEAGLPQLTSVTAGLKLQSLHHKSPVRYIEEGSANVYGSFEGFRAKPKSRVEPTHLFPFLEKYGFKKTHDKPMMGGYIPWRKALLQLTDPVTDLDLNVVESVKQCFLDDIMSSLTKEDLDLVHVLDDKSAMNGTPGVSYIDGLNRSTSAGNPWKKCKKFFLEPDICEIYPEGVKPNVEILQRFRECEALYQKGSRYFPVFCAHLKDEPTKIAKCESGKTRVFTGAPFDWTLVVRKYLLTSARLIQKRRFLFESAPGIIAQSSEWGELREYLCTHGEDHIVAGDYAAFDKRMPAPLILAAFEILHEICRKAGYSEEDLRVVRGIGEDTAFPLVDFNGDLIEFFGSNPSGHPLTVIINGLVNSMYMRYCYAHLSPLRTAKHFKRDVKLMTYGDDNVMGVSPQTPWFNHTNISRVLRDVGIEYTMADKETASIPFIHIDNASFLKRTWRWDEDIHAYVGPLEVSSIHKMLTSCVVSKTICPEAQAIAVVETAAREYFWYGKRTFENQRKFLQKIVGEASLQDYISDSTFPTHRQLVDDFWKISGSLQSDSVDDVGRYLSHWKKVFDKEICSTNCMCCGIGPLQEGPLCDFCFIDIDEAIDHFALVQVNEPKDQFKCSYCRNPEYYGASVDSESGHLDNSVPERSSKSLFREGDGSPPNKRHRCREKDESLYVYNLSDKIIDEKTNVPILEPVPESEKLGMVRPDLTGFSLQSDGADVKGITPVDEGVISEQQNVEFVDEAKGEDLTASALTDASFVASLQPNAALGDFLKRPVKIHKFDWSLAGFGGFTIFPWQLLFDDARIKKKLDNYAFMNCTLKVKIVVSASPFLYGGLMVSYKPLPNWQPTNDTIISSFDIQQYSHRPHVWIYPQDGAAAEMSLPFFFYKDWLLVNDTNEFEEMGLLAFDPFIPLASANGETTSDVSVSVYAWAEDVQLCGPTSGLALQSGSVSTKKLARKSRDEYGDGPVSKVASAISAAAAKLSVIPVIGPYMTATEIGAKGIAQISALFGWSNPPVIEDVCAYKSLTFHSIATCEISEPVEKLTLDPKNELTVDNSIGGISNDDELSISNLVQRDAILTTTSWGSSDAEDHILFGGHVSPNVYGYLNDGFRHYIQYTPMSHVAQLFSAWRGDIIYRFRVVASRYHRGRLAIMWDPTQDLNTVTDYTSVLYHKIVDIGETHDFEVRIPYMQDFPWMEVEENSFAPDATFSTINAVSPTYLQDNGTIVLRVLNELSAPVDSSTVQIIVSVRGAENLELADPREIHHSQSFFQLQSDSFDGWQLQADHVPLDLEFGGKSTPNPHRYLVNYGEAVTSVRSVMRRSSRVDTVSFGSEANPTAVYEKYMYLTTGMPPPPGYDPGGVDEAAEKIGGADAPYNFTWNHPMSWMSMCFIGRRGSRRWHLNAHDAHGSVAGWNVIRRDNNDGEEGTQSTASTTTNDPKNIKYQSLQVGSNGASGTSVTHTDTQAGLSYEHPMYTKARFMPASPDFATNKTALGIAGVKDCTVEIGLWSVPSVHTAEDTRVDRYCAIGTDFNFLFYLNAPTIVISKTTVVPS